MQIEYQFEYQPKLCFETPALYQKVLELCGSGKLEEVLSMRQKWLGCFYAQEIISGALHPDLILSWINPILAWGIFAGSEIAPQTYIGCYTGEIKRRKFWKRKGNDYCFDYAAGDFKTPFLIDAEKKGGMVRFINHSNEPNLETIPVFVGGMLHIILVTTGVVLKGSPLTYDYGEDYWINRDDPSSFHAHLVSANKI